MSDPYADEKTPLLIEFTTTQEELTPVRNIPWPNRDELEEKSNKAIEKAMTVIQSTAEKVNSVIKNVEGRPDHVEAEFGIKFDAEVGVILAKASMEASLNVTLSWDNLRKAEPQQTVLDTCRRR
jgi:hypothetical protein